MVALKAGEGGWGGVLKFTKGKQDRDQAPLMIGLFAPCFLAHWSRTWNFPKQSYSSATD